jgi:hypothetical protein
MIKLWRVEMPLAKLLNLTVVGSLICATVCAQQNQQGPQGTKEQDFFSAFLAGNLGFSLSAGTITIPKTAATIVPSADMTVTRVSVDVQNGNTRPVCDPPCTGICNQLPVIRVATVDGTRGEDLVITPEKFSFDTGPHKMPFRAGTPVKVTLESGADCQPFSPPADVNIEVQYRPSIGADATQCGANTLQCSNFCCAEGLVNATTTCNAGTCEVVCNSGFGNCSKNYASGCESNLNNDALHCGSCANSCVAQMPNASVSCQSGTCHLDSCQPNYGNCDNNPSNGCETLLNTNANCGGCGQACSSGQTCTFNPFGYYSCR